MVGAAKTKTAGRAGNRPERLWNVPNTITLGRIAAGPFLLLLLVFSGPVGSGVMGLGFLLVSLTDFLDGYLARRAGDVTRIGKLLDPLADKILITFALVALLGVGRLPLWSVPLVAVILVREIAVISLRAMASAEGVVLHASSLGKWKTGFQIAALTGLLLHYPLVGLPTHALGLVLLVIATGLTLWSGYDYFAAYLGRGTGPEERPPAGP
jgi:CDP-diacylglycerol--glycerol-3-phosphate 3-phosphatidyltransferase